MSIFRPKYRSVPVCSDSPQLPLPTFRIALVIVLLSLGTTGFNRVSAQIRLSPAKEGASAIQLKSPDSVFGPESTGDRLIWKSIPNSSIDLIDDGTRSVQEGATPKIVQVSGETPQKTGLIPQIQPANFQSENTQIESSPAVQVSTPEQTQAPSADPAPAGPPVPKDADDVPQRLTLDDVQQFRAVAEQQAELPAELKSNILKAYQRAAESLLLAEESAKKTTEFKLERDNGPELIQAARSELELPLPKTELELSETVTISELEQQRLAEDELANEVQKGIEAWDARAKVRAERKPQMPAMIERAKQQLTETKKLLEAPLSEGESPLLYAAQKTELEAYLLLLQQQLEQYRIEQSRYEALSELFPLRRDVLMRKKNYFDKRGENWKSVIADARRRESERQAREAREKLRNTHPALRELAERNAELTLQRKRLQGELTSVTSKLEQIQKKSEEISQSFQDFLDKESAGALSTGAGMLLRNQRNRLPTPQVYRAHRRFAEKEISRLQLELLPLQDERDDLGDIESQMELVLTDVGTLSTISTDEISEMARGLLNDRRRYLDDLLGDYSNLLTLLGTMDVNSHNLADKISEFENFIDERVLWVPSARTVGAETVSRTVLGAQDLFSAKNLGSAVFLIQGDLRLHPFLYLFAFVFTLSVLGFSRRIRNLISKLGTKSRSQLKSNVASTLVALGLTVVIASVWPVLLWLFGWRISSVSSSDFHHALGSALQTTAIAFWSMEVFRQIGRKDGIAEKFLEWSPRAMEAVHSRLLFFMGIGLPLMFLTAIADAYKEGYWADSVGRTAFVSFCGLLVFMLSRMLKPDGSILGHLFKERQDGLVFRTRYLWYPLVVLAPLGLGVLALLGYQYTAEQLLIRLQFTFWLSISLLIASTLVTQLVLVARKQIAMERARARRAALHAAHESSEASGGTSPLPPVEEPTVDLLAMNQQMFKLLRVTASVLLLSGSWMIWSQVMPALHVFNRVELWSTTVDVTETFDAGNGMESFRTVPRQKWITLGGLLFAVGIFAVAVLSSKNLPGLLELSLLQRLPLDHGERNAITTLCRYGCLLLGTIVACKTIGIGWSSVQWLVAALTVGLGFGLQEIFANFVSGLIILFERPIRIGDVVTIDSVTGSVSKIQIRATTITDWDRKEYIVPNKEFVTGRLLNWTLSDKTNRIMINVGVAYGSDTDLALELMTKVAQDHPLVLSDPGPVASFEGFGDSCLCLILRSYLPNLDHRLKVITDLHSAIDREFRRAGLEIAFPQMDLHIRKMPSKEMKLPVITDQDESRAA